VSKSCRQSSRTSFERILSTVTIFIHQTASCFIWRSAAWHVSSTAFGTVLSTVIIFIHQTASRLIWRSAAWNIGRPALGTILSTAVVFVPLMCHDHDAHVYSTTIRQKKQERLCQNKQDGLCRKKRWKNDRNEEKRDMHGKKEIVVRKME